MKQWSEISTSQMTDHCCIRCRTKSPHHFIQDHRTRINQKCHHVVAAWTVSHNPCPDMSGSMLADCF